mmetsp:Transcript_120692/g.219482  ORF Transcript_120692/g.219482 Transcript_120692/m.219482 type:complete len:238 (-) Transcript_120692:51-764(-)
MSGYIPQSDGLSSVQGTHLEPFLQGFEECGFHYAVDQFVEKHTHAFTSVNPDGSHPLVWNDIHREYKCLFDEQLDTILEYCGTRSIEKDEFLNYCTQLVACAEYLRANIGNDAELPNTGGVRVCDFDKFMTALTASEDYQRFLQVMLRAASAADIVKGVESVSGSFNAAAADPAALPVMATQQIDVTVPEGYSPGQTFLVEQLGNQYEVRVPDGYAPGCLFKAFVQVFQPPAANAGA